MKGGAYLALEASDQIAERWHKAAIPLAVATIAFAVSISDVSIFIIIYLPSVRSSDVLVDME